MCPSHLDPSLQVSLSSATSIEGPAVARWGCYDKGSQSEMGMFQRLGGHSAGQAAGFFLNCEGILQQALPEAPRTLVDLCPSLITDVIPPSLPSLSTRILTNVPNVFSQPVTF